MTKLTEELLAEVLRDSHRYAPGVEPNRPTLNSVVPRGRIRLGHTGNRLRDLVERSAARIGFTRSHHDAELSAAALGRILAMDGDLDRTADLLGDETSRRALLDLLKLRVLGPYHAPLRVTADRFRAMQRHADQTMLREPATFEVDDPFFSPISRYEVRGPAGSMISLHAHSVDIVSVFLLDQYAYRGAEEVTARRGDVAIDAGGCWGDTALYLADLVGPGGKVFSFEFDPRNLEILRANLRLNPELAERIELVEKALWDRAGERLEFDLGGRMTTLVGSGAASQLRAETITLDDFVAQSGLERVDFVKMDIEGAEPRALQGATATLAGSAPRLALAAYHREDDLVELPRLITASQRGYRCYLHSCSPVEAETVLFAVA